MCQTGVRRESSLLFVAATHLSSNAVHIGAALLCKGLADDDALVVVLELLGSDEAGFLELVEAVANVLGRSRAGLLSASASAVLATVVLSEASGAYAVSEVELVSKGCSAGIEPVGIVGTEFLLAASLNV